MIRQLIKRGRTLTFGSLGILVRRNVDGFVLDRRLVLLSLLFLAGGGILRRTTRLTTTLLRRIGRGSRGRSSTGEGSGSGCTSGILARVHDLDLAFKSAPDGLAAADGVTGETSQLLIVDLRILSMGLRWAWE